MFSIKGGQISRDRHYWRRENNLRVTSMSRHSCHVASQDEEKWKKSRVGGGLSSKVQAQIVRHLQDDSPREHPRHSRKTAPFPLGMPKSQMQLQYPRLLFQLRWPALSKLMGLSQKTEAEFVQNRYSKNDKKDFPGQPTRNSATPRRLCLKRHFRH